MKASRYQFLFFRKYQISKNMENSIPIAVLQLQSTSNKEDNFNTCSKLLSEAHSKGAKMAFLPEAFDYIAESKEQSVELAEPVKGPIISKYKALAKKMKIWLSLGGFHEQLENTSKIGNTHLVINDEGQIVSKYRKIHLFDVDIPSKGVKLQESSYVARGKQIVPPARTVAGKLGLGICYDLRFPEMSVALKMMGAQILTFPSAFTAATGEMHWEPLLRARAIETQTFVVAAAQTGTHSKKRSSWGHSMVVDPYGKVLCDMGTQVGISLTEINLSECTKIGAEMPVWSHRRFDLYPNLVGVGETPHEQEEYQFGQVKIPKEAVFLKTKYTIAFTNKRCVVPKHVLVSPIRVCPKFGDLTQAEVGDLFLVVQAVQRLVQRVENVSSSTIVIQDGPDAGQTIKHVHVHILPRRPGDFSQNDDIYTELQNHEKSSDYGDRPLKVMAEEASQLRNALRVMDSVPDLT